MNGKILVIFSLLLYLSFSWSFSDARQNNDQCKCDFNTTKYTAECDCSLVCAVAVENGEHCNIVCDGLPSSVEEGNSAIFGGSSSYINQMNSIKGKLVSDGFLVFDIPSFSKHSLPRLLRSAYIGATFISNEKKYEIDTVIGKVFSKYWQEVVPSFTKPSKQGFKKEFKYKYRVLIEVSYMMIKLTIPEYKIQLMYVR